MTPSRYELVGAANGEPLPLRVARARRRLDEAVEPRWRRHLEVTVRTDPARQCAVDRCHRPKGTHDLCPGHLSRWHRDGRPARQRFIATTDHVLREHQVPPACVVAGCRSGQSGRSARTLCQTHSRDWAAAGRPLIAGWLTTVSVTTDASASECVLPHCELHTEDRSAYCHHHDARWHTFGHPARDDFEAEVGFVK